MKDIESYHFKEYSEHPEIAVEVPQLTTLFGAFSDFINGFALMSTNDYGLRISISRRTDNTVRVFNATKQDKKKFQISNIKYRKEDRWANAVKAILSEFHSISSFSIPGLNITIKGQSAGGDNTSFTSAVFAGVAYALDSLLSLSLSCDEMVRICFGANRFSQIYNARLRDLVTIFSAEKGKVIFFDLDSYEYRSADYPFISSEGASSYFIASSIPYSVLTPEEDEFRSECDELFQLVRAKVPRGVKLREIGEKNLRPILSGLSESQRRYAQYVISESEIAKKAWEALLSSDIDSFSRLMNSQQKNITSKAELSSPEIDWIVRRGNETIGIKAISQVYVGISGTLLALIDEEGKLSYTNRLEEYERIFGFHAEVREFVPSGAIRLVELSHSL